MDERVRVGSTEIEVRRVPMTSPIPGRPTVVLVHGLGVSGFYFEPLIAALADHAPVVVFDLPGAGRSAELDGPLTIGRLAGVLHEILTESGIVNPVLVGHSMGTQVVVEALARWPGLASSAALLGPVVAPQQRSWPRLLAQFARTSVREPFGAVWRAAVGYVQMSPSWLLRQCRAMLDYRIEERISEVSADLMLMRSQYDYVCPPGFLTLLQRRAAGTRVFQRQVPDAAHHMMSTHADVIVAAVLQIAGIRDPLAEAEAAANIAAESG